jgi:serine/threonine-protein kinase
MGLLEEGQNIRGTYVVERFLGEGAFAEVYRVRHRFLGRQAMKVFKTIGMTIEETEQTLAEAILLSRIGHPNIVRVFDANTADTSKGMCGFFTMEYVAAGSLERFWRSHGVQYVAVERAVDILRQVCRGLGVAHGQNPPLVHRDVKPQNILVGYDDSGELRARVSDFGLAKRVNPLTLLASARGTRCFKAPETFDDYKSDSCAGDVWALGVTLYLMLTDRLPFENVDDWAAPNPKCFSQPIIPPSRLNIQVDPVLDRIVLQALAMNPKERYQTAQDLLAALVNWRPRPAGTFTGIKSSSSGEPSKTLLGVHSPMSEHSARKMAEKALKLAQQAHNLSNAADLMEEAFNKWPGLREKYEYHVKLWRRGILT